MLQGLMNDMRAHTSQLGKDPEAAPQHARLQRAGEEPFTFIAKALDRARAAVADLPESALGSVELEARLGIFCRGRDDARVFPHAAGAGAIELNEGDQARFFSGVTSSAFEHMKSALSSLGSRTKHTHEIVYGYADKQRIRCEAGSMVGVLEVKRKIFEVNVALPAAAYDLRISLAVENRDEQGEAEVRDGWEYKREKLRTSFTDPHGNSTLGHWVADFTAVQSDLGGGADETAEVELELQGDMCKSWVGMDDGTEADKLTSMLASRLWDTLKRLNPLERASTTSILKQLERSPAQESARQRCNNILQAAGSGGRDRFPGSMPVNLCRKDIGLVQQGSYWLAEKTDGVRYLLMVVATGSGSSSVVIDRSMAVYSFPGAEALARALPAGSVLDGELVFNRLTSSHVFLIFDLLFWGTESCMAAPYSERLRKIHLEVMPVYEDALQRRVLLPGSHLRLVGKRFYRRTNIGRLFDRVVEEDGHRVYRDDSCPSSYLNYLGVSRELNGGGHERVKSAQECLSQYYHKTDGIVFQPDTPYTTGTDLAFFKWKWLDTVTIDFAIQLPPRYRVTCGSNSSGGLDLTKQIVLEGPDLMRMRADMAALKCRIAELGFSAETGFWTYKGLRPDKSEPNYYTTVCTTMLELAEAIEEEELQYRMMISHPSQDDWSRQMTALRSAALLYRRQKCIEGGDESGSRMEE